MKRAFAIAAHPDDIEFMMAGTLMLLREAGYEIHYMNIANGSCGTAEYDTPTIVRLRRHEAMAAAACAGAVYHESLCNDFEIFYEIGLLKQVASVMREVAPEIVLTHSPSDYMEDHMNACRLAVTAAFSRGCPNFPVDPPRPATEQAVTVYHAQPFPNRDPLRYVVRPDLYVDIGRVIDRKGEMLSQHASQKNWLEKSQGQGYYVQTMQDLCAEIGRMSGRFTYAEGWRRHLHLGFCGAADDPLREALAADSLLGPPHPALAERL